MKRKSIGIFMPFFLCLITFLACQKSNSNLSPSTDSEISSSLSLAEAKAWFTNSRNSAASKNGEASRPFSNPIPDWSKAINTVDKDWYVIELPIRFDKSVGFNTRASDNVEEKPTNTKTSLVILKHKKTGVLRSALMHLTAGSEVNLQNINYGRRTNLSGTVLFTTMEGEFLNGWVYENGKIKSSIKNKTENTASRMELPDDCRTIQIDWYEQTCTTYPNNTEICSGWVYTHSSYQTVCTSDGSGGGGGTGGSGDDEFDLAAEALLFAEMMDKSSSPEEKSTTFTTSTMAQKAFQWIVVQQKSGSWKVTSYDIAEGYNSNNTGAIIYNIIHERSSISGNTSLFRIRKSPIVPQGPGIPLLLLGWSEFTNSVSIASDYKSGTVTVAGSLTNFGVPVSFHSQYCTVRVH
ncbi:MAG: hypothetical protein J0H92_19420 [Sphingobacteriales bacterium]|nr:hypothetical protein [Sphingobacteriales bacterium]OJW32093.1 MAG: hypothetical protein BGO54_16905 [Sphingobacteriales bacterium 46-32]